MRIAAFSLVLLAACAEEIRWPASAPPQRSSHGSRLDPVAESVLADLAGSGARNCGTATDKASADRVYDCASAARGQGRAFYCRFEPAPGTADLSPTARGVVWGWRAAYAGRDGAILFVQRDTAGKVVSQRLLIDKGPLHPGTGMVVPALEGEAQESDTGEEQISGIIIIRTIIGSDGAIEDSDLMKPLASKAVNDAALALVRNARFSPAKIFGTPIPVMYNVTVEVNGGRVRIRNPRLLDVADGGGDESAVTTAALESYFNQMHGGTGVAFPEERRPVLLHRATIMPSRQRLEVRVASPANHDAKLRYSTREVQQLAERLRGAQPRDLPDAPRGYALSTARIATCGPEYDSAKFTDAVAVSRPAFHRRESALLYVEYSGGARAYHGIRRGDRWEIDWYVELWACG